jgi:hypothetical protein
MGQEIDYTKVLADLEARRAAIEAAIVGVKAMLLGQGSAEGAPGAPAGAGAPHSDSALPTEVAPGVFHGMSVSEAARTFLEMKKQKQRTRTICDAMLAGGIESDARDFYSNVYTTLARNKDFFKRGKYWMLTSWDPRRAAAAAGPKPAKKTRRGKKGRKAQAAAGVEKRKVVDISAGGEKAETA